MKSASRLIVTASCAIAASSALCAAQTIDPAFRECYTIRSLGTPVGVPANFGGINFVPGNPNTLLIGGAANGPAGALYALPVTRNANNAITGFAAPGTLYSTAANIDGGVAIAPNNTIFVATFPDNSMHQILPGAAAPASTTSLSAFGVAASTGACQFVPAGFPGEGRLKIASYNAGIWYDFTISDPVGGVYTLNRDNTIEVSIGGGPEGIVFVGAGNPSFRFDSCIVSEYLNGRVVAYQLDSNGDPIVSTRRVMVTGLGGAEGGVRDPLTGSLLISSFGGSQVVVIEGFNLDCSANFNGDCAVDFFDYLDFLNLFSTNDPQADFNADGVVDFFDYLDFLAAYTSC